MLIRAEAIVCAVRAHGEHGAVARAMTAEHGLLAGYVRGGRSRRLRPVLQAGNVVTGEWRARTDAQLAVLTVELVHSRAGLLSEPLAAAAIDWATALTAATFPEGQACPRLHAALDGLLGAVEAAPAARGWAVALARYELLLLADLGFGLEREGYAELLPALRRLGGDSDAASWTALFAMLRLTRDALAAHLLTDRRADVLAARERLIDRIRRAALT